MLGLGSRGARRCWAVGAARLSLVFLSAVIVAHTVGAVPLSGNHKEHGEGCNERRRVDTQGPAGKGLPAIRLAADAKSGGPRRFVDADGRERIFHGVNAVVKGPPWRPATDSYDYRTSLVDEDFELLASAGVTVIRLGVMWAGVEPTRGVYDAAYVDAMVALARRAADYGIYTLLDMHQDVMSEKFCGEGLPAWAVQPRDALPFPQPVSLSPYPDDPTTGSAQAPARPRPRPRPARGHDPDHPRGPRAAECRPPGTARSTHGRSSTSRQPPGAPYPARRRRAALARGG